MRIEAYGGIPEKTKSFDILFDNIQIPIKFNFQSLNLKYFYPSEYTEKREMEGIQPFFKFLISVKFPENEKEKEELLKEIDLVVSKLREEEKRIKNEIEEWKSEAMINTIEILDFENIKDEEKEENEKKEEKENWHLDIELTFSPAEPLEFSKEIFFPQFPFELKQLKREIDLGNTFVLKTHINNKEELNTYFEELKRIKDFVEKQKIKLKVKIEIYPIIYRNSEVSLETRKSRKECEEKTVKILETGKYLNYILDKEYDEEYDEEI